VEGSRTSIRFRLPSAPAPVASACDLNGYLARLYNTFSTCDAPSTLYQLSHHHPASPFIPSLSYLPPSPDPSVFAKVAAMAMDKVDSKEREKIEAVRKLLRKQAPLSAKQVRGVLAGNIPSFTSCVLCL
jgi:hypothetical protein